MKSSIMSWARPGAGSSAGSCCGNCAKGKPCKGGCKGGCGKRGGRRQRSDRGRPAGGRSGGGSMFFTQGQGGANQAGGSMGNRKCSKGWRIKEAFCSICPGPVQGFKAKAKSCQECEDSGCEECKIYCEKGSRMKSKGCSLDCSLTVYTNADQGRDHTAAKDRKHFKATMRRRAEAGYPAVIPGGGGTDFDKLPDDRFLPGAVDGDYDPGDGSFKRKKGKFSDDFDECGRRKDKKKKKIPLMRGSTGTSAHSFIAVLEYSTDCIVEDAFIDWFRRTNRKGSKKPGPWSFDLGPGGLSQGDAATLIVPGPNGEKLYHYDTPTSGFRNSSQWLIVGHVIAKDPKTGVRVECHVSNLVDLRDRKKGRSEPYDPKGDKFVGRRPRTNPRPGCNRSK